MGMEIIYDSALKLMDESFDTLSLKLDSPKKCFASDGIRFRYRYEEKDIRQAILQKLVRIVTGLRAVRILNKAGFLQEQASLQRMLDEFQEDIMFLCLAIVNDDHTKIHKKYLDNFYQEKLYIPESAIKSSQKRSMIRRKEIRAFFSKFCSVGFSQSKMIENSKSIFKTYSGYLHGASPQIMELFFGNPPRFHLQGAQQSPFYEDHAKDIKNYFLRGIISFSFASSAFKDFVLNEKINKFIKEFVSTTGCA